MAYMRLGDLLLSSGVISHEQLERALELQKESKERLGDVLVQSGIITEQQLIDIVHATNVSALHDLLTEAAQAGKTELVVQLSAFEGQSYQVQQTVYQVQSAMGGSGWVTNFYPNAANAGVVEILMR